MRSHRVNRRTLLGGIGAAVMGVLPGCRCAPGQETPAAKGPDVPSASAALGGSRGPGLRLVTYNVLADPVLLTERIPALFSLLAGANADIIALQEVAPWFVQLLDAETWPNGYHVSKLGGERAFPGGQYLLSRYPILACAAEVLPGRQQRTALYGDIDVKGTVLRVATTHMESYLEDGPVRSVQLDRMFGRLRDAEHAVLLGDLNFGDGEPESSHIGNGYEDLWLALHPGQPGHTWDIDKSDLARDGSFPGEPSRRLDRVLLRSSVWRGEAISILGDQPVYPGRKDVFPSDHFGLTADLVQESNPRAHRSR